MSLRKPVQTIEQDATQAFRNTAKAIGDAFDDGVRWVESGGNDRGPRRRNAVRRRDDTLGRAGGAGVQAAANAGHEIRKAARRLTERPKKSNERA